jgi:acetyl-CoA acyltransferase 1
MAIRALAHAIQSGETSLGWAVGAENMSLKCVPLLYSIKMRLNFSKLSPRPTPEVSEVVSNHPFAHDCIQVNSGYSLIRPNTYPDLADGLDVRKCC